MTLGLFQIKLLERTLPENIGIVLDCAPDEYLVKADPTRIQQMLMNLALNARDAMPQGGVLRFSVERACIDPETHASADTSDSDSVVLISVADSGVGIPADVLPHIFEPFFTTKTGGRGSGLGLPQVDGIVAQHQGRIWIDSRPGEGTTFTILLPALTALPLVPTAPGIVAAAGGQREMILVVEDREPVRRALQSSLELLNYRTLGAANGREAIDQLARVIADAIRH